MKIDLNFLDTFSHELLERTGVPGMSVALFMDGQVIGRAYGLTDVVTGEKLTPQTAFPVASATKSVTALAMSILCSTGALDWDTPVSTLAADLCVGGEHAATITIRDILSHQSGFGWHDPLWYNSKWDRATIIRKAWQSGPERAPRSGFQYCNLMYMLAGEIIARVSGISYEDFVRRRILRPLGLNSAHFCDSLPDLPCPVTTPHIRREDNVRAIPLLGVAKANAACGLRMSASDMAAWLSRFCQRHDQGTPMGLPFHSFERLTIPAVALGLNDGARFYKLFGQPSRLEYGFGWFLRHYGDHRVILHSGKLPGACGHMMLLPDLGFGIVALTNLSYTCAPEALTMTILQRFFGGPQTDWISYYEMVSKELGGHPAVSALSSNDTNYLPLANLGMRTGDYFHPAYGNISLQRHSNKLKLAWANYRGDLIPKSASSFLLMNIACPLLPDGETVDFVDEGEGALIFLGRRFERRTREQIRTSTLADRLTTFTELPRPSV